MGLSALVITKNEQGNIGDCLESVRWADEVVVIDCYSNDATVEFCRRYTSNVYQRSWDGYASQKNYGHSKCSQEWVLSLDADERVTPALASEIGNAIRSKEFSAYRIYIRDFIFGKWIGYGSWPLQCNIRLYRRRGAQWQSKVHEKIAVEGTIGTLSNPLLHISHTSVGKFITKMNAYTDIEAQEWYSRGIKKSLPIAILSGVRMFWLQLVWYQGFRDGGHGVVLAILMGFYNFAARVKLWHLWYEHDLRSGRQSNRGADARG